MSHDARPSILLVDHQAHRRLALIDKLQAYFDPDAVPVGLDPLRTIRQRQPETVLIVVHPVRWQHAFQVCRWLKTDLRPIRHVGVVNLHGPSRLATEVQREDRADGFYQGPDDLDALVTFARALREGQSPVMVNPRPPFLLLRGLIGH